MNTAKQRLHDENIDAQKWAAMFSYVQAYNAWRDSLSLHKNAWHPEVQKMFDKVVEAQQEYKRMAKK